MIERRDGELAVLAGLSYRRAKGRTATRELGRTENPEPTRRLRAAQAIGGGVRGHADRRAGRALGLYDIERNGLRHLALNRHLYFVAASLGELNCCVDGHHGGLVGAP